MEIIEEEDNTNTFVKHLALQSKKIYSDIGDESSDRRGVCKDIKEKNTKYIKILEDIYINHIFNIRKG